jgi:hypothetical protein
MITTIYISEDIEYKITDEEEFDDPEEEVIFEIDGKFVLGMFDDMLGTPIDKVWKIIK